ncbi:tetratricopeptide repeat protein [Candidatus Caldatribacterium sp.]|uniref:tetratricopeptide repeat protein n=1 Tax=Candidatus Caldatribacterium sp. TaxID=2282143 RepID=UPI003847270B|nr:tetratricopeptide repeat protein [Candidatus Caldatribacterium sp.]
MILKRVLLGILVLCLLVCFWGSSPIFGASRPRVLFLPFVPRNEEKAFWGYLLRDLVRRELEKYVEVYDVVLGDNMVREAQVPWNDVLVQITVQNLGRKTGCTHVLTGVFRYREIAGRERLIVSPRLFKVGEGGYVDIPSLAFGTDEVQDFVVYLLQNVAPELGISGPFVFSWSFSLEHLFSLYEGVALMDKAIREYGKNQYPDLPLWQRAFALVRQTIDREPDYPEAYYYLACMYRTTRWWAKEIEAWEQYLGVLEKNSGASTLPVAQAYARLASFCLSQRKFDEALRYVERAAELAPAWEEVYLLWGKIWYEKNDMARAKSLFVKALELNPELKEAQYFLQLAEKAEVFGKEAYEAYVRGYQSFARGNFQQAAAYFEEAVQHNPKMKEAYYWLGRALYEVGDLAGSERAWMRLLELDPLHSQGQRFLERVRKEQRYGREAVRSFEEGYRLYEEARYEEAALYFERAAACSPFFSEAHEYLARCYYRMGKKEAYIAARRKAVATLSEPSERAWSYYEMGFELFGWGRKDEAKLALEEALRNDPTFGKAYLLLGEILAMEEDWLRALECYREAARYTEGEEKGRALWGTATALYALSRYADALSTLDVVVREYPYANFIEEAEALRIEVLAREKKAKEAEQALREFTIRFPESPFLEQAVFWCAFALYEEKDWEKAKNLLEHFLEKYPQSAFSQKAIEMLGYVYRFLGLEDKAQECFVRLGGEEGEFLVADSFYRKGVWNEARKAFERYLVRYPQGKFVQEAALRLAFVLLEEGELEEAERIFVSHRETFKRLFPKDTLRLQARLAYERGDWERVVTSLRALEEMTGALEREYAFLLALSYERLGKEEEARSVLLALGENPDTLLGRSFERKMREVLKAVESGSYERALSILEELDKEDLVPEEKTQASFFRGKCLYLLGRLAEARPYLEASLDGPVVLREEALLLLADVAYQQRAWNDVLQWVSLLKEERRSDPALLFRVAVAQYYLGNLRESKTILERLKERKEWDEQVRLLLLEELYVLKDYRGFLEEAAAFLERYPEHPRVEQILALSAWSAFSLEEGDKVRTLVAMYQERFPRGSRKKELLVLLAKTLLKEKNVEEIRGVLDHLEREGVSLEELSPLWYGTGTLLLEKQRFEEASLIFRKLFASGQEPFFTQAGYWLGVCLEYLERPEEAISVYAAVVQSGREDEWVQRSRERLTVLRGRR